MKFISEKPRKSGGKPTKAKKNTDAVKRSSAKAAPAKKEKRSGGGKKGLVFVGIVAALLVLAFFVVGAYANGLDEIYPNVSMEGVDLGGMSPESAANALSDSSVFKDGESKTLTVELPTGLELSVNAREAGCWLSAPDAAVFAMDRCHDGGFFGNTITYLRCLFGGMELTMADGTELNEDYLKELVLRSSRDVQLALLDMDVEIGEDSITVVKGASAVKIDAEDLYAVVKTALEEGQYGRVSYDAVSSGSEQVDDLNIDQLYETVTSEPINAVYDPASQAATESRTGRTFDKELAERLWNEANIGDRVVIPLMITEPEISTEQLNSMLFSEVLAQKSTTLGGSSAARINNITKAAAAINGIVMNPGDEFSYNGALGQRTANAGYMAAGAYSGGKVVSELGGGICQVSSTLYYCTLIANLKIVDRSCHYFGVDYLPAGLDATVSWPSPDFKFKNSSDYPIKIEAYVDTAAHSVVVRLYGCNPEGIRVEMTTETWQTADGYGAVSYRLVYDRDGNLISKTEEARSQYHYHRDDEDENPSPSPSEGNPSDAPTDPVVTDSPPVVTEQVTPPPPTVPVDPFPLPDGPEGPWEG